MADLLTAWTQSTADWQLKAAALALDDGLQSAVVISLFTDRLAEPGDPLPQLDLWAPGGRRGWWGDAFSDVPGDRIGSRLWLLARAKRLPEVLRQAEEYAQEALQWLVEDGVASGVQVTASTDASRDLLALEVVVVRSAQPQARYRFEAFWKGA